MENQQDDFFYTEDNLPQPQQDFGFTPTDEFANIRTQGYSVEFGDTFSSSWDFMKPFLGQLVAYTLLCAFSYLALTFIIPQIVSFMNSSIGYVVGAIVNLTVISALLAGFYSYFEKIYNKDKFSFQNLFDGFEYIGQLALYQLVFVIILILPSLLIIFALDTFSAFNPNFKSLDADLLSYGLIGIPSILIFTFYIFTPILIVLAKMNFWSAMEMSRKLVLANFTGVLGFVIGFTLLNILGLLFIGLGTLITIPFTFAATFILYVKLVKKNGASTNFSGDFYTDENAPLDAF
ncbi:hypothetical protein Fleli_0635 [Bernardetia litoralis DSM 6794]|uniref:Uncharacterized protein n=1 Tax=Bernardetia litoralis (strain ATCC 23117 / DSM 6794 / NBRC 15988 / NCIMB 1366 / Fx l1 / Sio-4) TaxID=880071 RepID=I4AGL4_BERLS|nr:hypothetical protein [Bernardetia litoralis]AFM03099.1 hypothetical protein Fleli_0635 [Bernardetia litoralis DSM 6794]